MTATQQDVILALLSLDAYNRGANARLKNVDNGWLGEQIGTIAYNYNSDNVAGATGVGFSASSYSLVDGTTVISYRGTDFDTSSTTGWINTLTDVAAGWMSSFGVVGSDVETFDLQPAYAQKFFEQVTRQDLFSGTSPSDLIITGHSLGGSLAGYVGSISGAQTVIFNEIPYLGLALNSALNEAFGAYADPTDSTAFFDSLVDILNGDLAPAWDFDLPDASDISSFRTTGEIATLARALGPFFGFLIQDYLPGELSQSEEIAAASLIYGNTVDAQQAVEYIDSNGGLRNPIDLHSQALMVMLTYADFEGLADWKPIGVGLMDALFDGDTANAVGADQFKGYGTVASNLMDILAYSVLDEGQLVFGNTGIRAMFDDADELGGIVGAEKASQVLRNAIPDLSNALVQFAGLMAIREVDYHAYEDQQVHVYQPEAGIFRLSDSDGNAVTDVDSAETLSVVIDQALWGLEKSEGEEDFIKIAGFEDMLNRIFKEVATNEQAHELVTEAISELYIDPANLGDGGVQAAISEIQYSLSNTALDLVLGSAASAYDASHAAIFAGTDQADVITGSSANNIIAGSNGDDTLTGGLGKDILLGGIGSDTFIDSVTERDADDGRQNERDIYVGSKQNIGALTDFLQWLITGDETDTVHYTVDSVLDDDPLTPHDEGALKQEGISITDLKLGDLGGVETIEITVQDLKSGIEGTDTLVGIEKVELSVRPDTFIVTEDALSAPIIIDMGGSGRIASELQPGEVLGPDDFVEKVDVLDYSGLNHGVNFIFGSTSWNGENGPMDGIIQFSGIEDELATIADYATGGALGYNDALRVTGADRIRLTDHDDVVINSEFGSLIETGEGNDKIWLMDGVGITDMSDDDRLTLGGTLNLIGGLKWGDSSDPWAWGSYGTRYALNDDGDLIVQNALWKVAHTNADGTISYDYATTYILNWRESTRPGPDGYGEIGAGGIFLAEIHISSVRLIDITPEMEGQYSFFGEGLLDIIGLQMKVATGSYWGGQDPLVLDLDGDGIELTSIDHTKARLDIDDDLYAEHSGFVGGDDGLLVRDLGGDGKITGSAEMFGSATQSGFAALSVLDGNNDGIISAADNGLADLDGDGDVDADDAFDDLLIWQDVNENHVTDIGELQSVTDRGIASISLSATDLATPDVVNGNSILRTGSYTMSDGTTHTIADVLLKTENQNTRYTGTPIEVASQVEDLPELRSHGTVLTLREAMTNSAATEAAVRAALSGFDSPNLSDLRAAMVPVLTAWVEGSPVKTGETIVSGAAGVPDYEDLILVRSNDTVIDYAYDFDQVSGETTVRFASGVTVVTDASLSSEQDFNALLTQLTADGSGVTVNTGQATLDGAPADYVEYIDGGASLRVYSYSQASWSSELDLSGGSVTATTSFDRLIQEELAFYDRYLGESFDGFFVQPVSVSDAIDALDQFAEKFEGILDLLAVRFAVQAGPLSGYFTDVSYDVVSDNFGTAGDSLLGSTFEALLTEAEQSADPIAWLAEWKPFFDVVLADYYLPNTGLLNSYSFMVQNILHAVEAVGGTVAVEDFARVFDVPDDLIINGSGVVSGTSQEDIILIDGDETRAVGGNGSDSYVVGASYGNVEVYDDDAIANHHRDILRFSAHNSDDIYATRSGEDLLLTDILSGATITITKQFEGRWPGPSIGDASPDYGIDEITFADGTAWTRIEIAEAVSHVDPGSTHLVGSQDIDVLEGGAGDDILEGRGDTDIYRFGAGDGNDRIIDLEDNAFRNDQDMLQFIRGIDIGDIVFSRDGASNDLTIGFAGNSLDSVTIEGQFAATYTGVYGTWYQNRIDLFAFDDGTMLTSDQIAYLVLQAYSTDGDDQLYGMNRQDTLNAGKGDDYISGGNQEDLYIYQMGDGHDVLQDQNTNILSGTDDTLRFGFGIGASDFVFGRSDDNINTVTIGFDSIDGSVTLKNQYQNAASGIFGDIFFDRIETIEFASGEASIDWAELASLVLASAKTDGNDVITGFDIDDVLDGGAGDDIFYGYNGNDSYVWGAGYGNDTIEERGLGALDGGDHDAVIFTGTITGNDIQLFRSVVDGHLADNDLHVVLTATGEQLTIIDQFGYNPINYRPNQVDEFHFGDGTIWMAGDIRANYLLSQKTAGADSIFGFWTDDRLDGGAGDDYLDGGDGSDTYVFGYGYGHDVIHDSMGIVTYSEDDKVEFGPGISTGDIFYERVGTHDLLITLTSSGETLLIEKEFYRGVFDQTDVEEFHFEDGSVLTKEQIIEELIARQITEGDDVVTGFDNDDVIDAGAGNDTVSAGSGHDIIFMGLGDDVMDGQTGNDVYNYARGDGHDTIIDGNWSGAGDRLIFADINSTEATIAREGLDLRIEVAESTTGAGDDGSLLLDETIDPTVEYGVEFIEFADGIIWDADYIRHHFLTLQFTDGDDVVAGFRVEDTIVGGLGDDALNGAGSNDTYVYARGDGNDTITEDNWNGSGDKLVFTDLNANDVSFVAEEESLRIVFAESALGANDGGSVLMSNSVDGTVNSGVELIEFADGTVWTRAMIQDHLIAQQTTDGDDIITGFRKEDTLRGGLGDDALNGGNFNDIYVYARGDGNDTITEDNWNGSGDRLRFTDINPDQVTLSDNGTDLFVKITESTPGTNDGAVITIINTVSGSVHAGVETIEFADGTVWDRAYYTNPDNQAGQGQITGTDGDDSLSGTDGDDTFVGGLGNDIIISANARGSSNNGAANGNDIYIYSRGDGNDIYFDGSHSTAEHDVLVLTDINSSDVELSSSNFDLTIRDTVSGSTLINEGFFWSWDTRGQGIDEIQFADGISFDRTDMRDNAWVRGTSGSETLQQYGAVDSVFFGDTGDDLIMSAQNRGSSNNGADTGNDLFIYRLGDGNDIIFDGAHSSSEVDRLRLSGINQDDVSLSISGYDLRISILPTGEQVIDEGAFWSRASKGQGIDVFEFEDGTVWDRATITAMAEAIQGTSGDDQLVGTSGSDTIRGLAGSDLLSGGDGNDTLLGGDGNDTMNGGAGDDVLAGGGGTYNQADFEGVHSDFNFVRNPDASVTVTSTAWGTDTLTDINGVWFVGEAKWYDIDDLIDYNSFDTINTGTAGDDYLVGTAGNDAILGGDGTDTLYGGLGDDLLDGQGGGYNQADYDGAASDYTFTRNADDSITVSHATYGTDTLKNIDGVWFYGESAWYDIDTLAPDPNTFVGTGYSGYFGGTTGDDTIIFTGGTGNYINADDGNDIIVFSGNVADYKILGQGDHFTIEDMAGSQNIQFTEVEYVRFGDTGPVSLADIVANSAYNPGDTWFDPEPIGGLI